MLTYSAGKYLKDIAIKSLHSPNKFVNIYDSINLLTTKQIQGSLCANIINQIATRIYEILSGNHLSQQLEFMLIRINDLIKTNNKQFLYLCQQYPNIPQQIAITILQQVNASAILCQSITLQNYLSIIQQMHQYFNQQIIFQIFFGLTYLWLQKSYIDYTKQISISFLSQLTDKLTLIEQKFRLISQQFIITRKMLWVGLCLFMQLHQNNKAENLDELIALRQNRKTIQLKQQDRCFLKIQRVLNQNASQIQQVDQIYNKFLKFILKYSLIDPQYHKNIINHVISLVNLISKKKYIYNRIIQYFKVIVELLKMKIFQNYIAMVFHLLKQLARILLDDQLLKEFLKIIPFIESQFLSQHINDLKVLYNHEKIRYELFNIIYQSIKNAQKPCQSCVKLLVQWNLQNSYISSQQIVNLLSQQKFQGISKQAENIIAQSKSKMAGQLLQNILKVKVQAYSPNKKHLNKQFIKEEVLDINERPYIVYTVMLINIITNPSIDLEQVQIDKIKRVGVSNNSQKLEQVRQCTLFLLKTATSNKVFDNQFFQQLIFLCSIIEGAKIFCLENIKQYLFSIFDQMTKKSMAQLLERAVRLLMITKNKLPVFITLSILLKYSDTQFEGSEKTIQKALRNIQIQLKEHEYSRIVSFSSESLKLLLILLQRSSSDRIEKIIISILSLYSFIFSKRDVQMVIYFYDQGLYKQILKNYKFKKQNALLTRKQMIYKNLSILKYLMQYQFYQQQYLKKKMLTLNIINPYRNQIQIIPYANKNNQKSKSVFKIEYIMIRNQITHRHSFLQFYSKGIDGLNRHKMYLKNDNILFCDKIAKIVLVDQQIDHDRLDQKFIKMRIEIGRGKFRSFCNAKQIICVQFTNQIQKIKLQLNGDLLLGGFSWGWEGSIKKIYKNSNYEIFHDQSQIKNKNSNSIILQSFNRKLSTLYLCAYLHKIFEANFKILQVQQLISIFSSLIVRSVNVYETTQTVSKSIINKSSNLIHYIFGQMTQNSQGNLKVTFEDIPKNMNSLVLSKIYFSCFIASVFNQNIFIKFKYDNKLSIVQKLDKMVKENSQFLQFNQNRRIGIFVKIFTIYEKLTQKVQQNRLILQNLLTIAKNILFTHMINTMLLQKINFLLFFTKQTQIPQLSTFFMQNIGQILSFCQYEDDSKLCDSDLRKKNIAKLILSSSTQVSIIVYSLDFNTQLKILDYFLANQGYIEKCEQFFEELSQQQFLNYRDWIICNFKLLIFQMFEYNKVNTHRIDNLLFLFICLKRLRIILRQSENTQQQKNVISLMTLFFKQYLCNKLSNQSQNRIIRQFLTPSMLELFTSELQAIHQSEHQTDIKFLDICFEFIFRFPKIQLLTFFTKLRQNLAIKIQLLQYIYILQSPLVIQPYCLSIFLQFTLQIVILVQQNLLPHSAQYQKIGKLIFQYLEKMIIQGRIKDASSINYPQLYIYPLMYPMKSDKIQDILTQAKTKQCAQLQGGIYFKLLSITAKLIQMFYDLNLEILIQFILEKVYKNKQKISKQRKALFRAINDFKEVKKDIKERHQIQLMIKKNQKQHLKYFNEKDKDLQPHLQVNMKVVKQKFSSPFHKTNPQKLQQHDLTPYFIDYFLMKLCMLLQSSTIWNPNQRNKVSNKYSNLFLKFLHQYEHIYHELDEKNSNYHLIYENVQDFYTIQQQKSEQLLIDRLNNPISPSHSNLRDNPQDAFLSPKKQKIRQALFLSVSSGKKRRAQIIQHLQSDSKYWISQAQPKKFHRYFRNQSKEILFVELIHTYYTIQSSRKKNTTLDIKKKRMAHFLNQYDNSFIYAGFNEKQVKNCQILMLSLQIKKVFPFTVKDPPVWKLRDNGFPSQLTPFFKLSKRGDYTQRLDEMFKCSLNDQDYLSMLSGTFISTSDPEIELRRKLSDPEFVCVVQARSQICIEQKINICEVSMKKGSFFCEWKIKKGGIELVTKKQKSIENKQIKQLSKRGIPISNLKIEQGKVFNIPAQKITEIFFRKHNQIRNSALEFFYKNNQSIMIIFYSQNRLRQFLQLCKTKINKFNTIKIVEDFYTQFLEKGYTQKWVNGQMSNFDYLMVINKFAGRSFADLSQYYIFPWVLSNYSSQQINLNDPSIYRDLSKPIGALNPQKLKKYHEKLANSSISSQAGLVQKYLYGSHYSTSLFILYYLVRIQPFTTQHLQMQSGQFDSPDRIFSSLEVMWQSLMNQSNTSDIKQCIPQFYYQSTFLKNINNLDLGVKQNGSKVNDVELPPWAKGSAQLFIIIMRQALQSDYVSMNLNYWIDLIFGKDQMSLEKNNLFYPLSYIQNFDPVKIEPNRIEAKISQIYYFGQNSHVLFPKEHKKKKMRINSYLSFQDLRITREDELLEKGLYVSHLSQLGREVNLQISTITKNQESRTIILDLNEKSPHTLIRKIQNRNGKLQRIKSLNNIALLQSSPLSAQAQIDSISGEVTIYNKSDNFSQTLLKFTVDYTFQKIQIDPKYFICYGAAGHGLAVFNWTMERILLIEDNEDQICDCFNEGSHFFYLTCGGSLFVYDWLTGTKNQILRISQKPTKSAKMCIYQQICLPLKKNTGIQRQLSYKFLIVGDLRHIVIFTYTHKL